MTVVCFGELLLRLTAPGRELLLQTPRLDVHIGGAEANVAVGLASFRTLHHVQWNLVMAATVLIIAPVIERSGKSCWVRWRYFCPKFLRQSFHEYAGESIRHSFWARAYYDGRRAKGKSPQAAVRALGAKLCPVRIGTRIAYSRAQQSGLAAQELEPQGKVAAEISKLYAYTRQHLYLKEAHEQPTAKRDAGRS